MTIAAALFAAATVVALLRPARPRIRATGKPTVSRVGAKYGGFLVGVYRRARSQATTRRAGIELVTALAAELRSGQAPRSALSRAARDNPAGLGLRSAATAAMGGDVPQALVAEAEDRAVPLLRSLAALWRVADGSGVGLAKACERLASSHVDMERVRREVLSQLAAPKATARVLAALPLFGVVMGNMLGADPVAWLLGSGWGLAVLGAGVSLELLGLLWIHRLTSTIAKRAS